jgi:N-acetylgalactosamine kinase
MPSSPFRSSLGQSLAGSAAGLLHSVREWLNAFRAPSPELYTSLAELYGPDRQFIAARCRQIVEVLKQFARTYGEERRVLITRCPGRINLMGRHVDHRGGYVNMMTIQREIVVVAAPRSDGKIVLVNTNEEFPSESFDIAEELPYIRRFTHWRDYLTSERLRDFHSTSMGKWGNYVRAGVFRLCHHYPDRLLQGMDAAVGGDIPMGAGLSSSSALLVAASLALVIINNLDLRPAGFVDLCGEGEWFVGTRGGAADHAAVTMALPGKVLPITFFPFRLGEPLDFPPDYELVVCNSQVQAKKTLGARDLFNHRVACYEIALALFRKFFPRHTENVEHLRDVTPSNLGVSLAEFYQMLLHLPELVDRPFLRQLLQQRSEWLEEVFATHREPTTYPLRAVFLYGVAECQRSLLFQELLRAGEVELIGRLMLTSHDGDRIARFDTNGAARLYKAPSDDAYLRKLALLANSPTPEERAQAALHWQPGSYACSCWEIDQMVDLARTVPGVVGAQLSGAGMGGCMMVLARREAVEPLRQKLIEAYYSPLGLEPQVDTCIPIAGASVISLPG